MFKSPTLWLGFFMENYLADLIFDIVIKSYLWEVVYFIAQKISIQDQSFEDDHCD